MRANEEALAGVAAAILDGTPVDWPAAETGATEEERRLLEELRLLCTVADFHRQLPSAGQAEGISDSEHPQYWGRLRLIARVGGGSFGDVYRAWDPRLHREIALKLIPVSDGSGAHRSASIIREGRLLARVRHPGVVAIYDAEQIGTVVGLYMEFIEGPTLEQRLAHQGIFTTAETVAIGLQLCDALSAAHDAGVLHRDVKAANVVVRGDGRIVLMDFGAGRQIDEVFTTDLTGTPLCLAPEVLQGQEATVRSDVYSLGVLLHYMVTGSYPVQAQSVSELRVAHTLRSDGARVSGPGPGVPARLAAVLERATHPRPERRHDCVAALSRDLRALQRGKRTDKRSTWVLLAALAVVVAVGASRWTTDGAGDEAARATARSTGASAGDATRITVLPFVNLGAPEDQYFVSGMTEEITSRLAGVSRLVLPSSTTMTGYDTRGKSLKQIGEELGVEYVVEGSVRWAPVSDRVRVRITPKLIRVAEDTVVWTDQYDASLADLFRVQAEIAYEITGALQVVLGVRERRTVEARPTADTEGYLAYLRGIAAYQQAGSATGNQAQARTELEHAVARDPAFALAWSWLARVYASQYKSGADRVPATRQAAYRAAQTAIDIDPALPDGHLGLAYVLMIDREYEPARRELEIARVGFPNSPDLLRLIGIVEQGTGRWRESLAAYMQAFDLDSASTTELIVIHYMHMRQYDEARRFIGLAKAANRAAALVPDAWLRFSESGDVAAVRSMLDSALETRDPADSRVRGLLARLEWFDGQHQRALDLINGMDPAGAWRPANFRFPASLAAAQVYESMGRREEAARNYTLAMVELRRRERATPEDYQIEAAMGLAAAGLGRAEEAVRHGQRAVELLPVARDAGEGPLYLYVLAEIHARLGQRAEALAALDEMFSVPGFYNETWVRRDPSFAALRSDPAFRTSVNRWSLQKGDVLLARRDRGGTP